MSEEYGGLNFEEKITKLITIAFFFRKGKKEEIPMYVANVSSEL